MALDKTSLHSDIKSILDKDPPSASEKAFADSLVGAYDAYASDAEDISGDGLLSPLTITSATAVMLEGALKLVNIPGITEATAITTISPILGTMLSSMWAGVTFAITAPGVAGTAAFTASELASVVSVPGIPAKALISSLKATEDTSKAADAWTNAMDTFTKTVKVTITGMVLVPGSTPVPGPPITAAIT